MADGPARRKPDGRRQRAGQLLLAGRGVAHAMALTRPSAVIADRSMADVWMRPASLCPTYASCLDDDAAPGGRSFWDLVGGASGRRPADLAVDLSGLEVLLPFSSGHDGPAQGGPAQPSLARQRRDPTCRQLRHLRPGPAPVLHAALHDLRRHRGHRSVRLGRIATAIPPVRPPTVLQNLQDERITIASQPRRSPWRCRDQPDLERYDLSSLRYMMWGATPIHARRGGRGDEAGGHPVVRRLRHDRSGDLAIR